MPRVRDVFARAYGPIPESATCHVGWQDDAVAFPKCDGEVELLPVKYSCERWGTWLCYGARGGVWGVTRSWGKPYRGDISNCDAAAFSPVFQCPAYDKALDELTREEADASAIGRTMRKYDLALHKLAKFSEVKQDHIAPGTVIALADAWAVAENEFDRESDPRAIGARYDAVKAAMKRFEEASRRYWAEISADGTGESPAFAKHNGFHSAGDPDA